MIKSELDLMLILNIITLAFFAGIYIATIKFQGKSIKDLKEYFDEKIKDVNENFKEHLNRVEHKQDKHNGLIERMVCVEASTKSAHHRIDNLEEHRR